MCSHTEDDGISPGGLQAQYYLVAFSRLSFRTARLDPASHLALTARAEHLVTAAERSQQPHGAGAAAPS